MNNQERAAEIMSEWAEVKRYAPDLAQALADAGLLMPDLPELGDGEWEEGRSVISVDDEGFVLPSIDSRPTHPGRARRLAYALLAAADYAEKGEGNA